MQTDAIINYQKHTPTYETDKYYFDSHRQTFVLNNEDYYDEINIPTDLYYKYLNQNYVSPVFNYTHRHLKEMDGTIIVNKGYCENLNKITCSCDCKLCNLSLLGDKFTSNIENTVKHNYLHEKVCDSFKNRNLNSCICYSRKTSQFEIDQWFYNKVMSGDKDINSANFTNHIIYDYIMRRFGFKETNYTYDEIAKYNKSEDDFDIEWDETYWKEDNKHLTKLQLSFKQYYRDLFEQEMTECYD